MGVYIKDPWSCFWNWVIRIGLDNPGFESRQGKTFWLALGPIQPCVLWVPLLSPGTERPWREFDLHVVTRLRINGAVPPLPIMSLQRRYGQLYVYFLASRVRKFPIFVLKSNVNLFSLSVPTSFPVIFIVNPSSTLGIFSN